MENMEFVAAMEKIIAALKERNYDPYSQLYGFVMLKDPVYITSHRGARDLIKTLDYEQVRQYVMGKKKEDF